MLDSVTEVLGSIPVNLDTEALISQLHVSPKTHDAKDIDNLGQTAKTLARPKAIYKVSYIDANDGRNVRIDGVQFKSRVLSANLAQIQRVFPYIGTCGKELDQLNVPSDDFARAYWVDTLKALVLRRCLDYLYTHLRGKYALQKTATMSPGAAEPHIWPIEQQKLLFSLFPDAQTAIAVTLTDSCLMIPGKSVSGILFPTEIDFRSCQVCRRKNCPSRAAPFDPHLTESYHHPPDQ